MTRHDDPRHDRKLGTTTRRAIRWLLKGDPKLAEAPPFHKAEPPPGAETRARAALVPGATLIESFADAPTSAMFPTELKIVATSSEQRRREFGTVRACARAALASISVGAQPILPDPDGAPRWPEGVVGSMTHCAGYRAAVVARASDFLAIGLDAEPHDVLPEAARDLVVRKDERALLSGMGSRSVHWDLVIFCAKEAVYKAWFPVARRWLEFSDVRIVLDVDGAFEARVLDPHPAWASFGFFSGRWITDRDLVVAAAWAPAREGDRS
jgi:4'-phosphopantetheinyl transferase EntD